MDNKLIDVRGVTLVCDTREHPEHLARITAPLAQYGVQIERRAMKTGDYMIEGHPEHVIEHKKSLEEICGNVTQGHDRFRRELIRALESGITMTILIEDPVISTLEGVRGWVNPRTPFSAKCIQGEQLYECLRTIRDRYGVGIVFCRPEDTGRAIMRLLINGGPRRLATGSGVVSQVV